MTDEVDDEVADEVADEVVDEVADEAADEVADEATCLKMINFPQIGNFQAGSPRAAKGRQ